MKEERSESRIKRLIEQQEHHRGAGHSDKKVTDAESLCEVAEAADYQSKRTKGLERLKRKA